jgi:hypothetical protein
MAAEIRSNLPEPAAPVPVPVVAGVRDEEAASLVRTALDTVSRAGTMSVGAISDALEGGARSLARRVVADAATRRSVPDRDVLARSLAAKPDVPIFATATAAALTLRVASRFRKLKFVAKRSPVWLLATAVPALVASVSRGSEELGLVAGYLVARSRQEGLEPDLERVRRAAVQVVSRRAIDPESEPGHGRLAVGWLRRAARAALPFTAGVATADPEGLAAAAEAVDPATLSAA